MLRTMKNRFIALLVTMALLTSMGTLFVVTAAESVDESRLLLAAQSVLAEYRKHYDIKNVDVIVSDVTTKENGNKQIEYFLEITAELKYDTAAELPQIRGLAAGFGIDSSKMTTQELVAAFSDDEVLSNVAESVSVQATAIAAELNRGNDGVAVAATQPGKIVADKDVVANEIADLATTEAKRFVENIETEYIGADSAFNIGLRAEFNNDRFVNLEYAIVNGFSEDMSLVVPSSVETMMDDGVQQAADYVATAVEYAPKVIGMRATMTDDPTYYKLSAKDYANAYTSSPSARTCTTPGCKNYNKSIRMDTSKYNPAYEWHCCNDCMNFVSQAMYAAGVPTDSTWYPDSTVWTYCPSAVNYFTNTKDWWVNTTITSAAAGEVIMMNRSGGPSHAAMVVLNNTVTRSFSAHTNDRLQLVYTSTASFGDYYSSIDFFGFRNWVVDYAP